MSMNHIARTPKQIGELIQRTRRQRDQSQAELGDMVGLRQETISRIENGNKATKIGSICDTLSALGLELVIRERSTGSLDDIEDIF